MNLKEFYFDVTNKINSDAYNEEEETIYRGEFKTFINHYFIIPLFLIYL